MLATLDFGGSSVKSGVALLDEHGALQALRVHPVIRPRAENFTDDTRVEELAGVMVQTMADVYHAACQTAPGGRPMSTVACSVAAYVVDGQPVPQLRGGYAQLHRFAGTANVAGWLARQVSDATGRPLTVSFLHDGTAAAASLAGVNRPWSTAVVMLGTALGIGFVPAAADHRPLAHRFAVSPL